jgi:outer membrane protein assembly factor BamD
MQKKLSLVVATCVLLGLSGCGMLPTDKADESKNQTVEKLYSEARADMDAGRYDTAVKQFERLESQYPFGTYAAQAQMEIAYGYYKVQDQAQALAAVERFIKLHPNHQTVDYMYYLRGLINFNDEIGFLSELYAQDPTERDPKATRESFVAFKALVDKFPDSKYTPDAIVRMHYLVGAMASYELHVAKYYFRRGAYLAALTRAQGAVAEYNDTPAREEALFLMVQCYDKMGNFDLRDDAQRVFVKNYPKSVFLDPNAHQAAWWKFWSKGPGLGD